MIFDVNISFLDPFVCLSPEKKHLSTYLAKNNLSLVHLLYGYLTKRTKNNTFINTKKGKIIIKFKHYLQQNVNSFKLSNNNNKLQ